MERGGEEGDKNCVPSFHSSIGYPEQEAGILAENEETAGGSIAATAGASSASTAKPTATAVAAATTSPATTTKGAAAVANTVATSTQER